MREKITEEVKAAMKAGDKPRLTTLRLIQSAIKDRDIANRGNGKDAASDDEILQILAKMVKQREESAKAFEDGGRPELAANERAEIAILRDFLPRQMGGAETEAAIRAVIAEAVEAGGFCLTKCIEDGFQRGHRGRLSQKASEATMGLQLGMRNSICYGTSPDADHGSMKTAPEV